MEFKVGWEVTPIAGPYERCGPLVATTCPTLSESSGGPVDVVAAVHNGQVDIVLDGHVDSVKGRLRTTFESTSDAPVTSAVISLRGAKKGLFVNSTDLCRATHKVEANFVGHNGKVAELRPVLKPLGCKGKKHKAKRHKREGQGL